MAVRFFIANYFNFGTRYCRIDWGFYLYDGIRNANPNPHPKYGYERPMFYTYKINGRRLELFPIGF